MEWKLLHVESWSHLLFIFHLHAEFLLLSILHDLLYQLHLIFAYGLFLVCVSGLEEKQLGRAVAEEPVVAGLLNPYQVETGHPVSS